MPQEGDATVERPLVDGRYALIAPLGRGGFGTVYRARDTLLQRDVAIKLLGSVSADRRERFLREARAMAKLHHPNIVDIYDAGEDEHGLYLVLELIDGRALSDTVPVERSRARSIVREVASALAAAHDAGIVHRDIKPANILIDGNGHAKVTDFGVARLAEDPTVTGKVIGTPAYMAPEQLAGRPVGPAADLYALGVVMRELGIGDGKLLDPDPQKRGTARDVIGARPKRGWQVAFAAAVILAAIVIASRKPKPVVDVQQQNLLTALAGSDFRKEPNLFTGPAPSSRKISYSGSVRASDFLALVARATKWPLVQDNSVAQVSRASIPLEVTNAAWDEVARNIIDTLGLSLSRDGDIWIVESQQRRRERERTARHIWVSFQLKRRDTEAVVNQIRPLLSESGAAAVASDGEILVLDTVERVQSVEQVVNALDHGRPDALVPANVATKYTGKPFTLNVHDADLVDVIHRFASFTGASMVIDPSVHGSVSLYIDSVPWDNILDALLRSQGLTFIRPSKDVVNIIPESKLFTGPRGERTVHLDHERPTFFRAFAGALAPAVEIVVADDASGTVVLRGDARAVANTATVFTNFDGIAAPQPAHRDRGASGPRS